MNKKYIEKTCKNANEFWEVLSPQNQLKRAPHNFIYRGQRDSSFELIPSILRNKNHSNRIWGSKVVTCDMQIF